MFKKDTLALQQTKAAKESSFPKSTSLTASQILFSDNQNKVEHRIFKWALIGLVTILLIFGTLVFWGATVPIASAVISSGHVTVDTNKKQIAHLEGGIVQNLYVRNGSRVKAGDTLIKLDKTRNQAQLTILESNIQENSARLARLKAEAQSKNLITFPQELLNLKNKPSIQELIKSEEDIFKARRASLNGQTEILTKRIEQLKEEVTGLKIQLDAQKRSQTIIEEEVKALTPLFERGQVSLQRMLPLRREAVQMEGSVGSVTANIARTKQTINETELQIIQLKKEARETVLSEMTSVLSEIKDLREQYAATHDILKRTSIVAPVSGTIVNLNIHSKNAVVRAGESLMEIVPDQDALLIEVQIQPQDIDNVEIGQTSQVRLTAFKQRTTPVLNGQVSYISPDTIMNPQTGIAHYIGRIMVKNDELTRLGNNKLTPGMPAEIMIKTGSRTAINYLIQPIQESMNRAWREE